MPLRVSFTATAQRRGATGDGDRRINLKRFRNASITIAGIELMHRIRKGQFKLGRLRIKDNRAPEIRSEVLAA